MPRNAVAVGWLQVQRGEESQVNIMGNVNQPFLATARYDVFFISTPPTFKLQLHVTGLSVKNILYRNFSQFTRVKTLDTMLPNMPCCTGGNSLSN